MLYERHRLTRLHVSEKIYIVQYCTLEFLQLIVQDQQRLNGIEMGVYIAGGQATHSLCSFAHRVRSKPAPIPSYFD